MAENYSIQAILSARDAGFRNAFDRAMTSVDQLSKKLAGDFPKGLRKASSGFDKLMQGGGRAIDPLTARLTGAKSAADGLSSRIGSGLGFGALMSIGSRATGSVIDGIHGIVHELGASSAAWQTFEGNMAMIGKSADEIKGTKKELQKFAQQTIYSASDMAQTYSQMASVGVKDTAKLVKGFGGLAAAAENPAQAMKTLSQQGTQMAAKPKIAWMDFKLMLEQTPAGMAAVAKQMGLSLNDLVAQVQAGSIKTQDFFQAVAEAGTNADFTKLATSYKTLGQAMDGLKETLAGQLMPAFGQLQQVGIKAISAIVDKLGGLDTEALAKRIEPFTDALNGLIDAITSGNLEQAKESLVGLFTALPTPIKQAGAAFVALQGMKLMGPIFSSQHWGKLAGGIQAASGALGGLQKKLDLQYYAKWSGWMIEALADNGNQLAKFAMQMSGVFSAYASGFLSNLSSMVGLGLKMLFPSAAVGVVLAGLGILYQKFGDQIDQMLLLAQTKGSEVIATFVKGITSNLPDMIASGGQMVTNLLNTITSLLPSVADAGMSLLSSLVAGIRQVMPTLVPAALTAIATFLSQINQKLPEIVLLGASLLASLADGVVRALPQLLEAGAKSNEGFVESLEKNLPAILQKGVEIIKSLVTGIFQNLPKIVETAVRIIFAIARALISSFPQIVGAGIQLIGELAGALVRGIPKVLAAVGSLGMEIIRGISRINLFDAGKAIIFGFLNGLKAAFGGVMDFIGGIGDWIVKHKGPLPYDRKMLVPAGRAIMGGFDKSLQAGFFDVKATVASIGSMIEDAMSLTAVPKLSYPLAGVAKLADTDGYGGQTIDVHVVSEMDGRAVGYGAARYVNEKNRFDSERSQRIGGANV